MLHSRPIHFGFVRWSRSGGTARWSGSAFLAFRCGALRRCCLCAFFRIVGIAIQLFETHGKDLHGRIPEAAASTANRIATHKEKLPAIRRKTRCALVVRIE